MAQQVEVNVTVGGQQIKHITRLRIDQSLFTHHTFEIVVPFEALEDKKDFFFKNAHQSVCGKPVTISFKPYFKNVSADFMFMGIATELVLNNNSEMVNSFIIKGHSPTYLLEDGVQRRAYVRQSLGKIFGGVLSDYPDNLLRKSIRPEYSKAIEYKAQYDESNFDFLSRLAAEYGEWFYYNGKELVVGKVNAKTEQFVIDGVQSFDMSISLKPTRFKMYHYNYLKHEEYSSPAQPVSGLGTLGDFAVQQSQGLFGQTSQLWPLKDVQAKGDLDDAVEMVNATNATDLVRFQGAGENPNLSVGVIVNVVGQKLIAPGKYKKENFGKYRITAITHTVDAIGNYENFFESVPENSNFPPRNSSVRMPIALPEIAKVFDNEDPKKLGRVRVLFYWPNQMQAKSSWIRVAHAYTGSSRGSLFIPEIDDQVMITYEANHVDFPMVVGSVYHKSTQNDYWFDNNYQKFIRTRGGNKIVFKDKPGEQELFITNANKKGTNFHISFKDDGTITLQTAGLIQMEAKDIKMTAKNSIEMEARNHVKITTKQFEVQAQQKAEIKAGQQIEVQSTQVDVKGSALVDVKGMVIKLNS